MEGLSETLIDHSVGVAKAAKARAIMVCADALADPEEVGRLETKAKGIQIVRAGRAVDGDEPDEEIITLPDFQLTRMGQVKLAIVVALSRGVLENEGSVVCLTGVCGSGLLDTLVVLDIVKEFEMFHSNPAPITETVDEAVFEKVLQVTGTLAREGREGRPVGTIFVLGDSDAVSGHVQQMILNPLEGHPRKRRNVMDPALTETIRELSAMDGAFIVDREGVLLSAGTYIDAPSGGIELRQGLGARHYAAAAVTKVTRAVAVALSESSGGLTVFKGGEALIEIEKPRERQRAPAPVVPPPSPKTSGRSKRTRASRREKTTKK